MTTTGFGNLGLDIQGQILDGLPLRFENVQLNPFRIANIMSLVTALGFNKLRPEVQKLMLDVQAERPDDVALVNALGNLAFGPALHNRRTAEETILKLR